MSGLNGKRWDSTARRESLRLQCSFRLSLEHQNTEEPVSAFCRDISRGGMGIYSYDRLKIGEKLKVWIHASSDIEPIFRHARVVWQKEVGPGFRAGLAFE